MKELKEGRKEITVLELNDGSLVGTCDFVFEKIGDPVPLNSNFDSEDPPAQAISVSDKFGIVFVGHAKGFYLVKIKEVAELAKKVKETGKTLYIKDSSISDVYIGKVYILALSSDSSTLAASIGGTVYFFSVDYLLNKEEQPSSTISLSESEHVQDLQWRKSSENSYVILSNHGVLYHGDLEKPLKDVMDNVDAVDWSVKGDFIAIARKSTLSLLSSQFKEQFLMSLPFQSGDTDSNCSLKVDSIKWVRDDSIILGCIQLIDDGKEGGYVVYVITSKECGIFEASSNPVVLSFDFFSSVNESILHSGHGPYLFASYLELWELALAANRKNIDGHIVMLGWLLGDRKTEATALDIIEDKWMPRIELQDNGDDNLIVGFGVASTSISEKFEVVVHDELKELSLYRVLLCLTIDGKLSLFRVARISEGLFPLQDDILPPKVIPALEEDTSALRSKELKVEEIALDAQRSEVITKEHNLDRGVQLRKDTSALRSKEPKVEEMALNAVLLPPKVIPALEEDTSVLRSKEPKVEEIALDAQQSEVVTEAHNLYRGVQLRKDTSALRSKEPKVEEIALNAQRSAVSTEAHNLDRGVLLQEKTSALRSKESKIEGIALGAQQSEVITEAHNLDKGVQLQKDTSALRSGRSANHKGEPKPDYQRNRQSSRGSNSEVDFSMDFGNVKEMANELDNLLLSIEEASGLRDAGSVFKKLVLALEEGLKGLSKGCRERKMKMEAQLGEIQNLLDKTMQVSARRIHMESIVKQVSSSQYWDLWNRQRLNPEFELKRRNILKANQNLTNHLIELERHFNAMEINKFGENGGIPKGRKAFQNSRDPSRQIHCLHSLYNTTSSQLAVAEELSEYLSKQMALLNIATPSLKRHNVAKELFDSIGLVHENYHFQSPDVKDAGHSPDLVNKIPCSTLFSSTKEYSGRKTSDAMKSIELETARRRRESLDRSWVSFEPQKTTVKRMLQEQRSKLSTSKSRFEKSGIIFNSRMIEEMDRPSAPSLTSVNKDQHQTNKYSASRDGQSKSLQQNPESSPTSFFKWSKYNSESSETMGLKSTGKQMQQASYLQSLSHAAASLSTVQDKTTKTSGFGLRSTGFGFGQSDPYGTEEVSTSEARSIHQLETRRALQTSRISGTILPTNSDLPKKAANGKAQPSAFSNFKIDENVQGGTKNRSSGHSVANPVTNSPSLPSVSAPPFPVYGSAPAFTSPISLPTISSIDSIPSDPSLFPSTKIQVSSSTTSFLDPKPQAASSPTPSPAENLSSQAPALSPSSSVPLAPSQFPSTKIQVSSSTPSPFLNPKPQAPPSPTPSSPAENLTPQTLSSPPKPLLEKLSATSEPALPPTPTNEVSTGSVFVKKSPFVSPPSTLNLFGTTPSSSSLSPNMAPAAQVLPLGPFSTSPVIEGKNEDSEDEMEEEAPDPTTEISFGALGAFGLGSTTEPSAPKPNPFGISFPAATNQASSQFSVTTPNGELFRPASFSLPTGQPSQPSLSTNPGLFSGGFGGGIGAKPPTASGFGQPAQIGAGQQALGSVLGSFGQSRQLGVGLPGAGHASLGGFGSGGFANAASGGVFPGTASGSGFAAAATGGGFAAAATGGGFAAAATGGGGFAAVSSGGGFQSFGNKQEGSAFSAFGGGSAIGTGNPPSNLFTQMRK